MPTRSFIAGTNKSRGRGRGNASPLRGPAKRSMCPIVGATHRVALGHSCQHLRSWPRQSNRKAEGEAMPRPHGPAKRSMCPNEGRPTGSPSVIHANTLVHGRDKQIARQRARQCLAPTRSGQTLHVSQRRGDPPGRPRSFMPTRSFMAATNKSRGSASGWWASPDEGEAMPRPYAVRPNPPCVPT